MTTKERRLVFVYSKLCDIDSVMNHCVSLLTCDKYDNDLANDEDVAKIRNELGDLEIQFDGVKTAIEAIVNKHTEYEDKNEMSA